MSEHLSHPEYTPSQETPKEQPEYKERHEAVPKRTHEAKEHDHNIDKIKQSIHDEAISGREFAMGEHHKDADQPILGVHRELKANAYKRTLHKVRAHLRPSEQAFSKVIHQPKVEAVSEISSKTIARPSGILGGGITALLGSGYVLYVSKYAGFKYNFFVFILFFCGGFVVGTILELLIRKLRPQKA